MKTVQTVLLATDKFDVAGSTRVRSEFFIPPGRLPARPCDEIAAPWVSYPGWRKFRGGYLQILSAKRLRVGDQQRDDRSGGSGFFFGIVVTALNVALFVGMVRNGFSR